MLDDELLAAAGWERGGFDACCLGQKEVSFLVPTAASASLSCFVLGGI